MYILIAVMLSMASPNSEAFLAHKAFATQAQCEAKGKAMIAAVPKEIRLATFCVKAEDLLEITA